MVDNQTVAATGYDGASADLLVVDGNPLERLALLSQYEGTCGWSCGPGAIHCHALG
jgi:hypothetical protein